VGGARPQELILFKLAVLLRMELAASIGSSSRYTMNKIEVTLEFLDLDLWPCTCHLGDGEDSRQ
jgi:hypothetical protein